MYSRGVCIREVFLGRFTENGNVPLYMFSIILLGLMPENFALPWKHFAS